MNNDPPSGRTAMQKIERWCFFLGILILFTYFLVSILNGVIYYTSHNDMRPLLTSTFGKVFAPDYILYMSVETLKAETLTKEAADGIKFQFVTTFILFILLHIGLAIFIFTRQIEMKYRLLLFLGIWLLYFVIFDSIYVFILSKKLYLPYTGFVKIFIPDNVALLFTNAGQTSIEATILTSKNVTLLT